MVWMQRLLPVNFAVGVTAVCVQLTLIVPWHHRLDEQLKELEQAQAQLEASVERVDSVLRQHRGFAAAPAAVPVAAPVAESKE